MDMDHLYEIVWADDSIDILLQDNRNLFERAGIRIHPFTNAEDALEFIRRNHKIVDGLITDAKYSAGGEAFIEEGYSFPGLSMIMRELSGLRKETGEPLPCWVFTGYGDRLREKYDSFELSLFNGIIDKKARYSILKGWVEDICRIIDQSHSPSFLLRQKDSALFRLCSENYLGESQSDNLLRILQYESHPDGTPPFNELRQIVEKAFDLLVASGVLAADTAHTQVTTRARALRDEKRRLLLPDFIVDSMILLADSSALSHSIDNDNVTNIDRYEFEHGRADALFSLLTWAMRTALPWIGSWLDDMNSNFEANKKEHNEETGDEGQLVSETKWRVKLLDGRVTEPLSQRMVKKSFHSGQKVTVSLKQNRDGRAVVTAITQIKIKPHQLEKKANK